MCCINSSGAVPGKTHRPPPLGDPAVAVDQPGRLLDHQCSGSRYLGEAAAPKSVNDRLPAWLPDQHRITYVVSVDGSTDCTTAEYEGAVARMACHVRLTSPNLQVNWQVPL